jgi:IS30 family transposase
MQVSHETIYKTLFIQTRGALKKELQQCLRNGRVVRKSRTISLKGKGSGSISDAISISERQSDVADRAIPGHWEGNLIQGSKKLIYCHDGRTPFPLCYACLMPMHWVLRNLIPSAANSR